MTLGINYITYRKFIYLTLYCEGLKILRIKAIRFLMALICRLIYYIMPSNLFKGDKNSCLGDISNVLGVYTVAIDYYNKALKILPEDNTILKKLATTYSKIKNYDKALNLYETLEETKHDYQVLYQWAKVLQKQGKYDEAIEKYRATIQLNPLFVCAYYNWANILEEKEEYDEAIQKYKQALVLAPNNSEIMVGLGLALEAKGDLEEANINFRNAIIFNPNLPEAYFGWGIVLEKLKDYKGAIEKYKQATELDPYYSDVYARWGEVLYLIGNYDGAIEKYKQAIKIDPEHTWAFYDLACAYAKLNKTFEATKYLKKALRLDSTIIEDIKNNSNLKTIINNTQIHALNN